MSKESTGAARGSVCAVHNEYSATGVCRWCEPVVAKEVAAPPQSPLTYLGVPVIVDPDMLPGDWRFVPLMDLDHCPKCGKSGMAIIQAGETYGTHPCFLCACPGPKGDHNAVRNDLCSAMSPLMDAMRGGLCCLGKQHDGPHRHCGGRVWDPSGFIEQPAP